MMQFKLQWTLYCNGVQHEIYYTHMLLHKYRLFLVTNIATMVAIMVLWHMMCFYTGQFIESLENQFWYFQQIPGSFKFVRSLAFSLLQLNLKDFLLRTYNRPWELAPEYPRHPSNGLIHAKWVSQNSGQASSLEWPFHQFIFLTCFKSSVMKSFNSVCGAQFALLYSHVWMEFVINNFL